MLVLFVLMLMYMSWAFSLAYASACGYVYACDYALVKTSLKTTSYRFPTKSF